MKDEHVDQLINVAVDTAGVLGFTIAPPCQAHIRTSLQQATLSALPITKTELPQPPAIYPADVITRVLLAKARVAQFVCAMAADALQDGPPPDMMLHEHNFFSVKDWICPLWPICS